MEVVEEADEKWEGTWLYSDTHYALIPLSKIFLPLFLFSSSDIF